MKQPLVSIIITAYNKRRTIGRCIRSAIRQSYGNKEVIVVDDCSTDGTAEDVARFSDSVTIIGNSRNIGHTASRQLGIDRARGEYITFVDGDDWLSTRAVERAVAHDADVVQMGVWLRVTKLRLPLGLRNRYCTQRALEAQICDEQLFPVQCWGKLYRRALLQRVNFIKYDGFWGEDRLFNMAVFGLKPSVAVACKAVYNYRWGGATCDTYNSRDLSEYAKVWELKKKWLTENGLSSQYSTRADEEMRTLAQYDIRRRAASRQFTYGQMIEHVKADICPTGLWNESDAERLVHDNRLTPVRRIKNIVKQML